MIRYEELEVEIQSSEHYPDSVDDYCNRVGKLFQEALTTLKVAGFTLEADLPDDEEGL
jgi:hypothetical protein